MKHISEYFKINIIQTNLEFVDINLDSDNLLFFDPRLIEIGDSVVALEMQKRLQKFWSELIRAVRLKDSKILKKLLSGLKEPSETGLGYSKGKHYGNSVGNKLKPKIIKAIMKNKAIMTGLLSHFSDAELFIEDVGCDRISDVTTKIIKEVLIDFTQKQCKLLSIPVSSVVQDDIFNYNTLEWDTRIVDLPVYSGKPIIFVPKEFMRLENSATSNLGCIYRFALRKFIQYDLSMLQNVTTNEDGRFLLKDIKIEYPLSKGNLISWCLDYPTLLVDFKSEKLNDKIKPLSDEDLMRVIYLDSYSEAV
ncbi:hypothetical protein [Tenacibaculum finnmarkense]|uniref:hypothetical protein n=1 Tax=Tenacibaculum finnmarkense TaxID=2781243 RepID=UPI000C54D3CA|nr:hypothetical protein [Tenacibaculum finnmarkense]MCD8438925.1 hypothetical protein [Tenacibaculum finnmarkense genomovar ulcerans]MCG8719803.1 hypothetical protein [Tenacibaculum finnmarkense]SOS55383.1 conserved hypothetical protein [Tenacibaculum finnmarkense]